MKIRMTTVLFALIVTVCSVNLNAKGTKKFTFEDAMKFKSLQHQSISEEGDWIAFTVVPDRGDPEVVVQSTEKDTIKYTVKRGEKPVISKNGRWVVMNYKPKSIDLENADKEKPKNGMACLNTKNGEVAYIENVKKYELSNDSKWVFYLLNESDAQKTSNTKDSKDTKKNKIAASDFVIRYLETGSELTFQNVTGFETDSLSNFLFYSVYEPAGKKNGIYYINLKNNLLMPQKIVNKEKMLYSNLKWNFRRGELAYISAVEKKNGEPDSCSLMIWSKEKNEFISAVSPNSYPEDWVIPFKNNLKWTIDGKRLFFGFKPVKDTIGPDEKMVFTDSNYYDAKSILKKTELDLWHWNDKRIKTNQKNWWGKNKDSIYRAVWLDEDRKFIQLADTSITDVEFAESPAYSIGYNFRPYLKEMTWEGQYQDLYAIDLRTGNKKLVTSKISENAYLAPSGKFVVYFKNKQWYLYNCVTDTTIDLTTRTGLAYWDEDWDQPTEPQPYGFGGWLEQDDACLLYDRYDVWKFYTGNGYQMLNQTGADGRILGLMFRVINLDPEKQFFTTKEDVYLSGFDEKQKDIGVYQINFNVLGVLKIIQDNKRFRLISRAKYDDKFLYSRESYDEFPDLWVSDSLLKETKKMTDYNSQLNGFNWGTTELTEWVNFEGDTLQGYLIKPDNFDPKKEYPLLVYFYERFSNMYYYFFTPRNNHRPCYPVYTGDGYLIFMPDIKYKTGKPGPSAYSCIVSGIRKIAQNGYVDTTAVGLQGHSWGGYQTAYLITKPFPFAAAGAGAPVGNMTSAYSGIRLESGLARQMQYEKQQSRIGGTLWDSLNEYIDNSPVFKAQTIKTPFLIMFGDEDDAVPWQQGVELYLAMRRLNKQCYFLQYHNEPHIPRKYQNKLDYAIKMKEFFDYFMLKKSPPDWIVNGIEYKAK